MKHKIRVRTHLRRVNGKRVMIRGHTKQIRARKNYGMPFLLGGKTRRAALLSEEATKIMDKSIIENINRINKSGFETEASCSGIRKEHGKCQGGDSYLSLALPEDVVTPGFFNEIFDVKKEHIHKPKIVRALIELGEKQGWKGNLSKYMMQSPGIHYTLSTSKNIETDKKIENDPRLVKAQKELSDVMDVPGYLQSKFDEKLKIRDDVNEKVLQEHGGRSRRKDPGIKKSWDKLTMALEETDIDNDGVINKKDKDPFNKNVK